MDQTIFDNGISIFYLEATIYVVNINIVSHWWISEIIFFLDNKYISRMARECLEDNANTQQNFLLVGKKISRATLCEHYLA